MKKIICFLMSVLIIVACTPVSLAAGGDGSESNPYIITTAQELMNINNDLDAHYKLANNINMSKVKFTPIGNAESGAFTGTLDGNGCTISGLSVYGKPKYSGLFGFCNGEIKNLTLKDVHIEGGRFSGGIAGFLDADGVISGCTVSGYVNAETSVSYSAAGGIAGYCAGEITNCTNKAEILASADMNYTYTVAGGIMGVLNSKEAVSGCVNEGEVKTDSQYWTFGPSYSDYYSYIGGIAGKAESEVSEFISCVNRGETLFTRIAGYYRILYQGGIIGYALDLILDECENHYDFSASYGNSYTNSYVGGLSGYSNNAEFSNCKNFGNIQADADYCGGIAAYVNATVEALNCENHGNFIEMFGCSYLGGIVAYCTNGKIKNSRNICNITSRSASDKVGGLCGNGNITLENCYNNGDIENSRYAYGLGGKIADNCYSVGDIESSMSHAISSSTEKRNVDNYFVGTMISYSNNSSPFNFGNVDYVSDDTFANRKMTYPTKLTDSQMQEEESFAGWDFENTWIIDPAINSGYPVLRCFYDDFWLNESRVTLRPGEKVQLTAYDNHNPVSVLKYESTNENAAVVSQSGLVAAVANGKTVISAVLSDGRRANCHVYVKGDALAFSIPDVTVNKGRKVYPAADVSDGEVIMSWVSSDENIATTTEYNYTSCEIYGVNPGSATVTGTSNFGHTYTCNVTVTAIAESVSLGNAIVARGEQKQLLFTVSPSPSQNKISFSSSDESIVTVDQDGLLTGVSCGTAIITATTDNGLTRTCTITVNAPVENLTLERTAITVTQGFTDRIIPITDPVDTTDTFSYSVSGTSYISVDSNGVITAKNQGTAIVTVTSSSGKKAYCSVTVVPVEYPVTGVSLDQSEINLNPGEITILNATVHPTEATYKDVRWTVDDTDVATVSQTGVVKAVGAGTTTVRVTTTDGSYISECTVNVIIDVEGVALNRNRMALNVGETTELIAKTLPEAATNKNVIWYSEDETIASVTDNGVITANGIGKTIVSVESVDGNYKAECFINVATDTYEITWEVNDWVLTEKYAYGEEIIQPEIAEKKGYHFVEWSEEIPETMPAENLTFVALFEEHQPVSFGEEKAPTCMESGSQAGEKCSVCDAITIEPQEIPALGHKWGDWTVSTDGIKTRKCSVCEETETSTAPENGITVTLTDAEGKVVREEVVSGDMTEFSFADIADGEYTLIVSKSTYVTKTYPVSVTDGKVSVELTLRKIGDVTGDGKVNTIDVARANANAKGVASLTGYEFICADINGDGKVNTIDVARMNAHAKGVNLLW